MVLWCSRACRGPGLRLAKWAFEQRASLVNVKLKWVKDRTLDRIVARDRHLRHVLLLLHRIAPAPAPGPVPARDLPHGAAPFLRRFPTIFCESSSGGCGPCFLLTYDALRLREEELQVQRHTETELVDRLRRLLMLTVGRSLPLLTLDQLAWDLGLPPGYAQALLPLYPHFFELARPPGDERVWLKLVSWDPRLAVSELQKRSSAGGGECLAFPVSFTRGFGLPKKCLAWLHEWQTLPYTSPYASASHLDPRTDVSEKRNVGVFHELLHLTLAKKTARHNLSNLRRPLALPHKFTKVFERHPGVFYLSRKLATQTVVLREAYANRGELLPGHPLLGIRERYTALIKAGMPDRRHRPRSLNTGLASLENATGDEDSDDYRSAEEESDEWCSTRSNCYSDNDCHNQRYDASCS